MTTVKLYKSMDLGAGATTYTVTLDGGKVEETITKEVISYSLPFTQNDWGTPTAEQPKRESIDLLNLNRVFTITGTFDALSCDSIYDPGTGANRTPVSAPEVRDIIVNMIRYGGTIFFNYGVPGDTTGLSGDGYSQGANNIYFTSTGFECHINRIQIQETQELGAYRSGSSLKDDFLVDSALDDFSDSRGTGEPKYGTYFLPSKYEITIELVNAKENTS